MTEPVSNGVNKVASLRYGCPSVGETSSNIAAFASINTHGDFSYPIIGGRFGSKWVDAHIGVMPDGSFLKSKKTENDPKLGVMAGITAEMPIVDLKRLSHYRLDSEISVYAEGAMIGASSKNNNETEQPLNQVLRGGLKARTGNRSSRKIAYDSAVFAGVKQNYLSYKKGTQKQPASFEAGASITFGKLFGKSESTVGNYTVGLSYEKPIKVASTEEGKGIFNFNASINIGGFFQDLSYR